MFLYNKRKMLYVKSDVLISYVELIGQKSMAYNVDRRIIGIIGVSFNDFQLSMDLKVFLRYYYACTIYRNKSTKRLSNHGYMLTTPVVTKSVSIKFYLIKVFYNSV